MTDCICGHGKVWHSPGSGRCCWEDCGCLRYATLTAEGDPDIVNSPSHYLAGGVETIDVIAAWLGPEQFKGYCRGNTIKYLSRSLRKGDELNDLRKARWYATRLIETLEGEALPDACPDCNFTAGMCDCEEGE